MPAGAPARAGQIDAFEDQPELGGLDRARSEPAVGGERGPEAPAPQPLRPHRDPVAIPIDDADPIAAAGEEDVEVARQRIMTERIADDRHQAVGALSAVDRLRRDEDADARRQAQHPRSAATSRANAA